MDLYREAELLQRVPLFAKLAPSKLRLLAFTSEVLAFEDGDVLFRMGDTADAAYVILDGAVEFMANTSNGEVVAGTLGAHELLGELGVLTGSPRAATARAQGRLQAIRIDAEVFLQVLLENPEVSLDVLRQISEKLVRSHRQVEALRSVVAHEGRASSQESFAPMTPQYALPQG